MPHSIRDSVSSGPIRPIKCKTNVLIRVPQASPLLDTWRQQLDPSAAVGVPPHITLLYPAIEPSAITVEGLEALARASVEFPLTFRTVETFERTIWIKPTPTTSLQQLENKLKALFPMTAPYGGQYPHSPPHLTVADGIAPTRYKRMIRDLQAGLPIHSTVHGFELWGEVSSQGQWHCIRTFGFGTTIG